MDYVLDISNLTKNYSGFTLDGINIKIPNGKIVGLIGENGAGKTTLINLILNQIKRETGEIKIFGKDNIKDQYTIKQDIGFFVDECCFHTCLNAKNISNILGDIYKNWNHNEFFLLLSQLGIEASKKIKDMSKGMKNKLMLAAALSHNPSLLILDEVTSGLDPVVRDDILLLLKEYVQKNGAAIFFSTHITSDLETIADEIAFIHNGKLILFEPLNKIKNEFRIINCRQDDFGRIEKRKVIVSSFRNGEYTLLIKDGAAVNVGSARIPTINEIMLLYIKGDTVNEGFD